MSIHQTIIIGNFLRNDIVRCTGKKEAPTLCHEKLALGLVSGGGASPLADGGALGRGSCRRVKSGALQMGFLFGFTKDSWFASVSQTLRGVYLQAPLQGLLTEDIMTMTASG